jgi:hypothetical protein
MGSRLLVLALLVALSAAAPSASAKDFGPGDLRLCDAARCAPLADRRTLDALAGFYYSGPHPDNAPRPRLGAPQLELRFRNGYVTGIVATGRFDRFLSYGVHLGWFRKEAWYRVPAGAALELRRLAAALRPLRLTRAAYARSH